MTSSPLATGGAGDPFLIHLIQLFADAAEIAIVAAFILDTGLIDLESHLNGALSRGARVRVLTGNYLGITQARALRRLLDWSNKHVGRLEAKVIDMAEPERPGSTFHPKSWRFEGPKGGVAFVGSSNISRAALRTGVEWNLRVERAHDPRAYQEIERAFERLWGSPAAKALTAAWIEDYERRLRQAPRALAVAEAFAEAEAPIPHAIQFEALAALGRSRAEGLRRRALVVLATGLGKTWLAAFDAEAYAREELAGRTPRLLFLAHREEILAQAERTFRLFFLRGEPTLGWFAGERGELDADFVFASVQKLSRPEHLARLAKVRFDYAIVDEVHHGTAQSYRAVLDRLDAGFLLGLTATPERADGADVLGLFDDHLAFRADIGVGIQRKLLVPFHYWGIKDDVDYSLIEWKNQRFDPIQLVRAIDTKDRLERLWAAWSAHGGHEGRRTLVFCASIEHADHTRAFLEAKGVRAVAVHSGPGSAERALALSALERGEVEAVCAVDILNEGVDVPQIDRVVMLRPTESPVVFLQQLGRGLRVAPAKERLTVLDFIGNHRIFLDRVRHLAALGERPGSARDLIEGRSVVGLPPGCTIEIEAKDVLLRLLDRSAGGKTAVERAYNDMTASRGVRPTLGELYRIGCAVEQVRTKEAGWFDFVLKRGGLDEGERRVFAASSGWLRHLETTKMNRSFKMVTVQALLEAGALLTGLDLRDLSSRCYAILRRSPELFSDLEGVRGLGDPRAPDEALFLAYWTRRKNPIDAWLKGRGGEAWFIMEEGRFKMVIPISAGDEEAFFAMTREVVDYRLAEYQEDKRRQRSAASLTSRRALTAYPSLRAAAGAANHPVEGEPEASTVRLPTSATGERLFAVRAAGDSMAGGRSPIRHGDWLILRRLPPDLWSAVDGEVALCAVSDDAFGESYLLKRVVRGPAGRSLRSDNPDHRSPESEAYVVNERTRVVAKLLAVVRPEDLGPKPGTKLAEEALSRAFGIKELEESGAKAGRFEGHLFLFLEKAKAPARRFRPKARDLQPRPGETAFVLFREPGEERWCYLGVAEVDEREGSWSLRDEARRGEGS